MSILQFPKHPPRLIIDTTTSNIGETVFRVQADRKDGEFVLIWSGSDYDEALYIADVLQRSVNYGYRFSDLSKIH